MQGPRKGKDWGGGEGPYTRVHLTKNIFFIPYNIFLSRMAKCLCTLLESLIDENLIFIALLVLLCVLALLLVLIVSVTIWLAKLRNRVNSISNRWKDFCRLEVTEQPLIFSNKDTSGSNRSDPWKRLTSSNAYAPWIVSGDVDLKETSFGCSTTVAEDERSIHGINIGNEIKVSDKEEDSYIQIIGDGPTIKDSPGDQPEKNGIEVKRKMYMSLKGAKADTYANLREEMTEVDSGKGEKIEISQNLKSTNGTLDGGGPQNEYDHGYLVVFGSGKPSETSELAANGIPPREDAYESQYLLPVDSQPKEIKNQEEGKEAGERFGGQNKAGDPKRMSLTPKLPPRIVTFGPRAVPEIQKSQNDKAIELSEISKSNDEDSFGYLLVQHDGNSEAKMLSGSLTENLALQRGTVQTPTDGGACVDDRNDDNYDYITSEKVKDWKGSPDVNNSVHVPGNDKESHPNGKPKTDTKPSDEDGNGYLAVIHDSSIDDKQQPERHDSRGHITIGQGHQDSTDDIYATIQDNNNDPNKEPAPANPEAIYVNQDNIQSAAEENTEDTHIYANSDVQEDSSLFDIAAQDIDKSPIYDNDIMKV